MILLLLIISIFYSCGPVESTVTYNTNEKQAEERFNTVRPENKTVAEETGVSYWPIEHAGFKLSNTMREGSFKVAVDFHDDSKEYKVAYSLEGYPADCENGDNFYKDDLKGGVVTGLENGEIYYVVVCAVSEDGLISRGIKDKIRTLTADDLYFSFDMQVVSNGSESINSEWNLILNGVNTNLADKIGIRWSHYHWEGQTGTPYKRSYEITARTTCDSPNKALEVSLVNKDGEFSEWKVWEVPESETSCFNL